MKRFFIALCVLPFLSGLTTTAHAAEIKTKQVSSKTGKLDAYQVAEIAERNRRARETPEERQKRLQCEAKDANRYIISPRPKRIPGDAANYIFGCEYRPEPQDYPPGYRK